MGHFIHALLRTKLPLEGFYREYHRLCKSAISFRNGVSLLSKFPLRERPAVIRKARRWYRSVRTAYRDYRHARPGGAVGASALHEG